jgi:hypothetical protein
VAGGESRRPRAVGGGEGRRPEKGHNGRKVTYLGIYPDIHPGDSLWSRFGNELAAVLACPFTASMVTL